MYPATSITTLNAQEALDREILASLMLDNCESETPRHCARVIGLDSEGMAEGFNFGDARSAVQSGQLKRADEATKTQQAQKGSDKTNDQVGGAGEEQLARALDGCLTYRAAKVNHDGCSKAEKGPDLGIFDTMFDVKTVWVQRKENFSLPARQAHRPHAPYLAVVKFLNEAGTEIDVFVCRAQVSEDWKFCYGTKGRSDYYLVPLDKRIAATYQ